VLKKGITDDLERVFEIEPGTYTLWVKYTGKFGRSKKASREKQS
jgi:hypothetical protein